MKAGCNWGEGELRWLKGNGKERKIHLFIKPVLKIVLYFETKYQSLPIISKRSQYHNYSYLKQQLILLNVFKWELLELEPNGIEIRHESQRFQN